jgi:hypothetical protein
MWLDLLSDVFDPGALGIGPSTPRGLLLLGFVLGLGLSAANGWLLATAADALREPLWGLATIGGAILFGPAEILLSVIHLRRTGEHTGLAIANFAANAVAIALAILNVM